MLFAILEFSDFLLIAVIVMLIAGSSSVTAAIRKTGKENLRRVEAKLDLILSHLNIEFMPYQGKEWQELAAEPGQKIAAIKAYREETGVGLKEAKDAVEEYMDMLGKA